MRSASISIGKVVRGQTLRRDARLKCHARLVVLAHALEPAMDGIAFGSMLRSAFCTPGTSVMMMMSSPLRNTLGGGSCRRLGCLQPVAGCG